MSNKTRGLNIIKVMKEPKWNDDKIVVSLQEVIGDIGHFPTSTELKSINKKFLVSEIYHHGGFIKFRKLMGYNLLRKRGYWNNESIIKELRLIIDKIGHFPTTRELTFMKRYDLFQAIVQYGGMAKFRKLMGYTLIKKPTKWNDKKIINELKIVIKEIGHFPTQKKLGEMDREDLCVAIGKHGGINKFRISLGYDLLQKPDGYWTDETTLEELKIIIEKIGHFPAWEELILIDRHDLANAIIRNGGMIKFHNLLGYTSIQEKYISELHSYSNKRGHSSESILKQILIDYCSIHNLSQPQFNKKLSKGHVLEFVCNTNKKIGIDVTNTKSMRNVSRKWTRKSYHLHLDELWIVVFGTFEDSDYIKWNNESPPNVKVFSIYQFLEELNYSLDEFTKSKIDKYNSCTFHTKEEYKKQIGEH